MSVFPREVPIEQVFTRPQLIAIEVLSTEDRLTQLEEKIQNYFSFGVSYIWLIDSETHEGWDCSNGDWIRRDRFEVAGTPMYLSLPEIFTKIEDDNT